MSGFPSCAIFAWALTNDISSKMFGAYKFQISRFFSLLLILCMNFTKINYENSKSM